MDARTKEAVRYLGYGRNAIDEQTLKLIEEAFQELDKIADVKFTYRIFEISSTEADIVQLENIKIKSHSLYKNLNECKEVIVMGITLGAEVDRRLRKYEVVHMPMAVVFQACAAAYLEEKCDALQEQLRMRYRAYQLYLRPRFSPGYGDFSITHQKEILDLIEATKRIGLTMTDSCMLVPTKSVTAVIGISSSNEHCHREGCEMCGKTDCIYRRSM